MTGAMYAAVSGLKTHMSKLNVIGNNIANANTYGYKSQRTVFTESIYSSLRGGSNGSASMGGVNPSQLGYGVKIGTIDLDMSTQSYVPTGRGLDSMIFGDGFFCVGPKPEKIMNDDGTYTLNQTDPRSLMMTRVGNFTIDSEGYLVDGNGYVVYGFVTCAGVGVADDTTGTITVTPSDAAGLADKDNPAVSTQLVPLRLPMAAVKPENPTAPGAIREGAAIFPGINDAGYNVYDAGDSEDSLSTGKIVAVNIDSVTIDGTTGKISCTNSVDGNWLVLGYIPLAQVTNTTGMTHMQGPYFRALDGAGACTVASIGDAEALKGKRMNNGDDTSTESLIFGAGEAYVITGGLESSGTDIATEFSEMITTQRGYQANTRIVTVTDSMLEELVNMKR